MKGTCPHCGGDLEIQLRVDHISKMAENNDATDWRQGMTSADIAVAESAEANGLLDCLRFAVENGSMRAHPPKNMHKFLVTFLRTCTPKMIPSFALQQFKALYPNKEIRFYSAQSVGCMTAGGAIQLFVPVEIVSGATLSGSTKRIAADEDQFRKWIKTKGGYVPQGARVFLDTLRKKSFGEFANPVL